MRRKVLGPSTGLSCSSLSRGLCMTFHPKIAARRIEFEAILAFSLRGAPRPRDAPRLKAGIQHTGHCSRKDGPDVCSQGRASRENMW
jgi:hypothetical protein